MTAHAHTATLPPAEPPATVGRGQGGEAGGRGGGVMRKEAGKHSQESTAHCGEGHERPPFGGHILELRAERPERVSTVTVTRTPNGLPRRNFYGSEEEDDPTVIRAPDRECEARSRPAYYRTLSASLSSISAATGASGVGSGRLRATDVAAAAAGRTRAVAARSCAAAEAAGAGAGAAA